MVMNKNDVISRDAVVQFIGTEAYKQMMGRAIRRAEYLTKVRDEIFKIPSLEVTPVTHAHWDQQDDTHIGISRMIRISYVRIVKKRGQSAKLAIMSSLHLPPNLGFVPLAALEWMV